MKKLIYASLALLTSTLLHAQNSNTMGFMEQLPQSQWICAANMVNNKITIGLPAVSGISLGLYNSGFTYHDVFKNAGNDRTAIRIGNVIDKMKSTNYVGFDMNMALFSLTYAKKDLAVGISANEHFDFRFNYPKDIFALLWYGNAPYIGTNLEIGNFGINSSWYREYALHVTKKFNKLTVGVSPKLLYGKMNIYTKQTSVKLYTDAEYYALTTTAALDIRTSGIPDTNDLKGNNSYYGTDYVMNTKNGGFAIDAGARYYITPKLDIGAGVYNLGSINWNSRVHNYKAATQPITFDGIHAEQFLQSDSSSINFDKLTDSLRNLLEFSKNSTPYKTVLPYSLYAIVNYKAGESHYFGGRLNLERFNKTFLFSATLNYQFRLSKHFTLDGSYTYKNKSAFNIGGGLIVQLLNMQWYIVTDNWWAAVKPLDTKNMNISMGMNAQFGNRVKKKHKKDDDSDK
ncbi:MAG: hypothetical protein EBX41_05980 [Chitinophagia bacterium]|nr:hypothetical protein [Chitinophagia bacterium]